LISTALAGLLLLAVASSWWLLESPAGAAWLWGRVTGATDGAMHASHQAGDLGSGFTLGNLTYRAEGLEFRAGTVHLRAGLDLWPLGVQVQSLLVRDVNIVSRRPDRASAGVDPGVDIESALTALRTPVPVTIHSAELFKVTYGAGVEEPAQAFESLRFSAVLHEALTITGLELSSPGLAASLDGRIALLPPFDLTMVAEGLLRVSAPVAGRDLEFPFRLESAGNPDRVEYTLASSGKGIGWGNDKFAMNATGATHATGMQLERAVLRGNGVDLSAKGSLEWRHPARVVLDLDIGELDLHRWVEDWPAGERLLGNVQLAWDEGGWKVPAASLAVAGGELAVQAEAEFDAGTGALAAAVRWENLGWPLSAADPVLWSREGSLVASGSIDRWVVGGVLWAGWGEYPEARVGIEGHGIRTSASLRIHQGEILGGRVTGAAGLDWHDGLAWELEIQAEGIDPEPLLPGWPGRLDAEIKAGAAGPSETVEIDIASLQGSVRDVPVQGRGGFAIRGETVTFEDVEIGTGTGLLKLDGSASDPAGISLRFEGDLPSALLQGVAGHARFEGRYSNAPGHAFLDVQMDARDLAWNGFSAAQLALNTRGSGDITAVPAMRLMGSGFAWNDVLLDEVSLALEPSGERHVLNAALSGAGLAASAVVTLAPGSGGNPFTAPWEGVVDELLLTAPEAYSFALTQPAPLHWAAGALSTGPLCLRDDGGADLCVKFASHPRDGWSLSTDVVALPLDYARGYLDLDVRFEQVLQGQLDWRMGPGGSPAGRAEFNITAGRILELDDGEALAETSEGRLGFLLKDGNLESGMLDLGFPGVGFVEADFSVLDIAENGRQQLQGVAKAQLDDLSVVGQLLLPAVDDLDGRFAVDLRLGGTLADPLFDGGFKLTDGRLRYAPVGLAFHGIEISGVLDKRGRGSLAGSFQAGDGTGIVDGNIIFDGLDSLEVDASLSGDRLLLVNTDNLKVSAGADLRVRLSPQRVDINGRIVVPEARLRAADLVLEKVSDSEDLVVRGAVENAQAAPQAAKSAVHGELEVTLGDDVVIEVPDVETRLSGSVLFSWQGGPVPIANGSYRVRGEVDVYGPRLQIDNGSINFPGVPADNPLLNIRAERDIYGNTQVRSAGVQVSGTLKRPVVEAYTVPETNRDRAWSLLVTGMDYDPGQGVSGFDVGTYIAPRLYVAYGISLFEDENVLSARYDLKKGFGVKVTSGANTTGVDVSYTVDR
jgi:translocation and assembly module TamB